MVDVFVHRTGLDTAAVEERCDLVQVVPDCGKLPCDSFDLVRVDILDVTLPIGSFLDFFQCSIIIP